MQHHVGVRRNRPHYVGGDTELGATQWSVGEPSIVSAFANFSRVKPGRRTALRLPILWALKLGFRYRNIPISYKVLIQATDIKRRVEGGTHEGMH